MWPAIGLKSESLSFEIIIYQETTFNYLLCKVGKVLEDGHISIFISCSLCLEFIPW